MPKFKKNHMNPQALEFFEREILISSEEYLGKAVFPRNVGGTDVGAYLLVTFDGNTQEECDAMVEQAFDDQCTGANPRYPLMKEIKQMYLSAYYGAEANK